MRLSGAILAVLAAILALPASAPAAALVPVAPSGAWVSDPIHGASPPADPRLFVAERGGGVRVVEEGVLRPTPFLTVPNVDTSGERGLLSIAFPPDYAASGRFYAFAVAKAPDAFGGATGDLRVLEYRRSATDPNLADPGSARLVLAIPHSATNHNGGQLAFGPDGLLYMTVGDNAVPANAQAVGNLYGKVLRIDPREQPGGLPYGVPASNPFVGTAGAMPEIYALGLRNPFRASFSPVGDLIVADVGQGAWEEIDVGRATGTPPATALAGANLGWPSCEGACPVPPPQPGFTDPFFQYVNGSAPRATTGCAVIGGYVVRDRTLAGLTGRYLYGDACRVDLRSLDLGVAGGDPQATGLSLPGGNELLGFGEDGRGCVYAMTAGTVFRVTPEVGAAAACPEAAAEGQAQDQAPASSVAADSTAPRLAVRIPRRQPLRRIVRVLVSCDEACSLRATAVFRSSWPEATASAVPPATLAAVAVGQTVTLAIGTRRASYLRAAREQRRGAAVTARVRIAAADPSGNRSRRTVLISLRRPPS